jgi:hypothetical protein
MRDNFSAATKRTLAGRAANICTNPDCWSLTIGPHSDSDKVVNTGHAAHIHGAAPGGPRFDPSQTPAQRKSISNGLWMCRNCGTRVDSDVAGFTAIQLRMWKASHEAMIAEIGQQGYARTIELLQARRRAPDDARKIVALLDNHAALWEAFDAEFPDRVRQSLDRLRDNLTNRRVELPPGSSLDAPLLEMIRTIQGFFRRVVSLDLATLRCNSGDPDWRRFETALGQLRRELGTKLGQLATLHGIAVSAALGTIANAP